MTSEESDVVGKTNMSCSTPEGPGCDSSELDCNVCFCPYDNVFKAPKVLSCHHTFCLECLARMNVSSVENKTLVCPLCREETHLETGKGLPDLPNNLELIGKLAPEMQGAVSVRFNRSKGRLWVKKKMDPASLIKPSKVDSVSLSLDVGRPPSRVRTGASRLLLSTCSCYTAIASMVVVTVVLVLSGILIFVLVPRLQYSHYMFNQTVTHIYNISITPPPPNSTQI
ncbi:RING finger protein 225-like isoform X1 [Huso huso]|uniref:RING finger protein 225-like isoform X1 n=1 Tax=Huso huso TaxID=61971 RepID=A0ABR0YBZ9_HUSHU